MSHITQGKTHLDLEQANIKSVQTYFIREQLHESLGIYWFHNEATKAASHALVKVNI